MQNEMQNQYKTHQRLSLKFWHRLDYPKTDYRANTIQPVRLAPILARSLGFNKRKMEDTRRQAAEKEAAARRATEKHAVTALIPALSCRSRRPNAPFAELVCLSKSSVAEEYYAERSGNRWVRE
jgi:hypothetical protein